MLVISRKDGERVFITIPQSNEKIVITTHCKQKGKVCLCLSCPKDMKIMREEILRRK